MGTVHNRHILEAMTLSEMSWFEAIGGDFDRAYSLLDEMAMVADELGSTFYIAGCAYHVGEAAMLETALERAAEAYERSASLLEGVGERLFASTALVRLGECRRRQGDPGAAVTLTKRVEAMAAGGDIEVQSQWRNTRAQALAVLGSMDDARRLATEAVETTRHTDFVTFDANAHLGLARVERAAGEHEAAQFAARHAYNAHLAKENNIEAGWAKDVLRSLS